MLAGDFNLADICWEYGPGINWWYQNSKLALLMAMKTTIYSLI